MGPASAAVKASASAARAKPKKQPARKGPAKAKASAATAASHDTHAAGKHGAAKPKRAARAKTKATSKPAGKRGAKPASRKSRAAAETDWQLEGGWIEVFDEPANEQQNAAAWIDPKNAHAMPDERGAGPRRRALPSEVLGAIDEEPMTPPHRARDDSPQTMTEPEAQPESVAAEEMLEAASAEGPEPAMRDAPRDLEDPVGGATDEAMRDGNGDVGADAWNEPGEEGATQGDALETRDEDGGDDEDEKDDELVPHPTPIPDGPVHPEREPAPIEHPDTTEPDDEEDAMDVGMVVMEEPEDATSAGGSQTVVAQRTQMPLSQEMPAKGDIASGLSLPEQFLLVAYQPGWDDAMERARPGSQGAAIVGSVLLELALRGAVKVQRGRFTVEDDGALPPELAGFAADVRALGGVTTQVAMERLAKGLPDRIRPWVSALERRGVLREERARKLGVLARSQLFLLNDAAKGKLENRLVRTLAGGGNPDARTIMLLGLVSASGLLRDLVPASAYDFNRKRIQALLSGRDTLSYRVDNSIRRIQDLAVQTVLADIRVLQGT